MVAALVGFLGLLVLLVVGVLMAIGGPPTPDRDDVPEGMADAAVEVTRTDTTVTVTVAGDPDDQVQVSICPGLLPGPSDAPGLRERIRVSGCVPAVRDAAAGPAAWTLTLSAIDPDLVVSLDAAERWLVVVVDPQAAPHATDAISGAWIPGGPVLP